MSYYDVDAILTESQKVPCTFQLDVPGLGYLDGNPGETVSNDYDQKGVHDAQAFCAGTEWLEDRSAPVAWVYVGACEQVGSNFCPSAFTW